MHCAVHVKIKLRADIKNAAAQSCILPDFCLPLKSIPTAMGYLGSMGFFGNPSLLPVYQILSTLLKYFVVWKGPAWLTGGQRVWGHMKPVFPFDSPRRNTNTAEELLMEQMGKNHRHRPGSQASTSQKWRTTLASKIPPLQGLAFLVLYR